jgi:hypothetical protein
LGRPSGRYGIFIRTVLIITGDIKTTAMGPPLAICTVAMAHSALGSSGII